jgi:hypothetical protein
LFSVAGEKCHRQSAAHSARGPLLQAPLSKCVTLTTVRVGGPATPDIDARAMAGARRGIWRGISRSSSASRPQLLCDLCATSRTLRLKSLPYRSITQTVRTRIRNRRAALPLRNASCRRPRVLSVGRGIGRGTNPALAIIRSRPLKTPSKK